MASLRVLYLKKKGRRWVKSSEMMSQSSELQASWRVRSSTGRKARRSYSLARAARRAFWWVSVRTRVTRRRTVSLLGASLAGSEPGMGFFYRNVSDKVRDRRGRIYKIGRQLAGDGVVQSDDAVAQLLRKGQRSGDVVAGLPRHVEVVEAVAHGRHGSSRHSMVCGKKKQVVLSEWWWNLSRCLILIGCSQKTNQHSPLRRL